jgi:PTH1 family peptidyl-tRNA hydrolase
MNRSGWPVRCLADLHQLDSTALLIVFDDVDLPFGRLRLRARGGPGGHRGMESIVEAMRSEEIPRLRLGIAPVDPEEPPIADLARFVLEPFAADERGPAEDLVGRAAEAAGFWLEHGVETAMNRINAAGSPPTGAAPAG